MKHPVLRGILAVVLIIMAILAVGVAWLYAAIAYSAQGLGFHNYDANSGLQILIDAGSAIGGVVLIGLLIWWGFVKRPKTALSKR